MKISGSAWIAKVNRRNSAGCIAEGLAASPDVTSGSRRRKQDLRLFNKKFKHNTVAESVSRKFLQTLTLLK